MAKAINLATAMPPFAIIAATTALLLPVAMLESQWYRNAGQHGADMALRYSCQHGRATASGAGSLFLAKALGTAKPARKTLCLRVLCGTQRLCEKQPCRSLLTAREWCEGSCWTAS